MFVPEAVAISIRIGPDFFWSRVSQLKVVSKWDHGATFSMVDYVWLTSTKFASGRCSCTEATTEAIDPDSFHAGIAIRIFLVCMLTIGSPVTSNSMPVPEGLAREGCRQRGLL